MIKRAWKEKMFAFNRLTMQQQFFRQKYEPIQERNGCCQYKWLLPFERHLIGIHTSWLELLCVASMVHIPYLVVRRPEKMVMQKEKWQKCTSKDHKTTSCEQFPSLSTVLILFRGWEAKPGSSSVVVSVFDLFDNSPRRKKSLITWVKEAF